MRLLCPIVAALTVALLMPPCGAGVFGAVLCIEADGHTELEEHGCVCTSAYSPDDKAKEEAEAHHATANVGDEGCEPCVDIPITMRTERHGARLILVKTTLGSFVFLEMPGSNARRAMLSFASSPLSYQCKAFLADVGSIPLRI
jgi:hypothetical protein